MTTDAELLHEFAATHSEPAFAELVHRHVNLVYSAALRQVNGDAHLAQDVAQTVFTDLARKAGSLASRETLTAWLYTSAHFAATNKVRGENRRRDREEEFMREPINESAPEPDWEKLRPVLDDAMHELKEADREAVLLRYFENRQFVEVGAKLGLNENAARMRVERALEKLRDIFTKRGITPATALASVISANAVQLAPAGLAATLTTSSIISAGTGTITLMKILTATKLKLAASVLVVAGATTALVLQHQTQENLRADNTTLTQQLAQLQTDNESLSNRLAAAGDAKSLSDDKMRELLKLRGEVGVLRRQVGELGKLQEQNQELRNEVLAAHQEQIRLPTEGQYEWHQTNTINAARFVLLGMIIFSGDNHDRFPTNFSQISTLTEGMTNQTSGVGTEAFELVNAGSANNQESFKKIVIREQAPFQTTDGKWARTYGFADGHVEVPISADGNFGAYETQHKVASPNQ
ncbi:MAG TPA: sigma-70 family RNA polymerase sigma factor [Verrucomicrobiae bacterium]|nr:sigma-70 family RNA polymerase sigma factor [Verrucomicrobiae bacterium]